MQTKTKSILLFVLGTAFAWLAYAQAERHPVHLLLAGLESATFGAGLAFVASAWPAMRGSTRDVRSARLAYVAITYVLLTWTLGDTLILHTGMTALDLLLDEHVYHATVVAAGAAVARYLARLVQERPVAASPQVA